MMGLESCGVGDVVGRSFTESEGGAVSAVRRGEQGFGSMDKDKQRAIASEGGKAAHRKGTAHQWTSEEARAAGRKGGLAYGKNRRKREAAAAAAAAAPFDANASTSTNTDIDYENEANNFI